MSYRSPDPPASRVVSYGRYRPKLALLALGSIFFAVGALLCSIQLTRYEAFECDRTGGTLRCVHSSQLLWHRRQTQLTGEQIASVEWVPYTEHKSQEWGRTEVFDPTGRPLSILSGPRAEARRAHEELQTFLTDPSQRVYSARDASSPWLLAVGAVLGLAGMVMLGRQVRRPTSAALTLVPAERRVEVTQRYLGLIIRRTSHSLKDVKRIEVQRDTQKHFTDARGHPGHPVARLRIRHRSGKNTELTPWLPDGPIHDEVANELRAEAGLPTETPAARSLSAKPALSPSGDHRKVFKWWLTAVLAVSVLGFGIQFVVQRDQGTLEIHCDHRCRFQGMDCRPGGVVSGSYDPGDFVIEVFDPKASGGWRRETARVERHQKTVFRCR